LPKNQLVFTINESVSSAKLFPYSYLCTNAPAPSGDIEAMVKKSVFFDLFSRHRGIDLDDFLRTHREGEDYIVWNGYVIPNDFGDAESEYHAIRNCCAMFDVTPIRKYRIHGSDAGVFLDHLLTRPVTTSPLMRVIYVAFWLAGARRRRASSEKGPLSRFAGHRTSRAFSSISDPISHI
jgi:hypothetical protein